MEKEILLDQIDFAQARIEEIEKQVINYNPENKGYKELVESYNKWIDRLNTLTDKLEHFDEVDSEVMKLNLERDKMAIQQQLEQDKLNIETERIRFEREKFAYDVQQAKWKEPVDVAFKTADLGVKTLVPIAGLVGTIAVAKIAYSSDLDMKLCNGRVFGAAKDLIKIATMKV